MQAIGEALPGLEADVVGFQEVWTDAARQSLLAGARRAGLTHAWHNRGELGGSGLLVVSRLPLRESRFQPFLVRGRPERVQHGDYWGGKGFALLGLETPDGPLACVDTHLHAQYADQVGDDYHGEVMAQAVQLAAALADVAAPLVALGDFNLREAQPHHAALTGLAALRDAAIDADHRQPTVLASCAYREPDSEERIDYVFVRDGGGRGIRVRRVDRVLDEPLAFGGEAGAYSDHAGLRTELEIAAPARPLPAPDARAAARARQVLETGRERAATRRRERRGQAGLALSAGTLSWLGAARAPLARRRFLQALLVTGGAAALPTGCGLGILAERADAGELRAYDEVLRRLDAVRDARPMPPSRQVRTRASR
jgi:endonuclease/exonuclease/phosphatase family metal-dependent hydrolase